MTQNPVCKLWYSNVLVKASIHRDMQHSINQKAMCDYGVHERNQERTDTHLKQKSL